MIKLPEEMWFGTTDGQWPIECWESEGHAFTPEPYLQRKVAGS